MTPAQLMDDAFVKGIRIDYNTAKKFAYKGMTCLVVSNSVYWQEIHSWCHENFGENYTWAGGTFAFSTDEDATMFKLAWG